jgi:hypothetical protein
MGEKSSPDAITLTYDHAKWTIPALQKFPRDQRFLLGDRIERQILDILELLISANYSKEKLEYLKEANLKLEVLRFLWRLSLDLKYLDSRRYEFVSVRLHDIGNLVGGWIKQQKARHEKVR